MICLSCHRGGVEQLREYRFVNAKIAWLCKIVNPLREAFTEMLHIDKIWWAKMTKNRPSGRRSGS